MPCHAMPLVLYRLATAPPLQAQATAESSQGAAHDLSDEAVERMEQTRASAGWRGFAGLRRAGLIVQVVGLHHFWCAAAPASSCCAW